MTIKIYKRLLADKKKQKKKKTNKQTNKQTRKPVDSMFEIEK